MHEIELIKRARRKRNWEKYLPIGVDEKSVSKRREIVEAIETDQWLFREQVCFMNLIWFEIKLLFK